MYTPRQIWQHTTPKAQLLIALSLATILAFSAGLAAGIYGRATYLPTVTTDRNAIPAVAQPPQAAPAVQQPPAAAVPRNPNVPISGTGSAYDGRSYGRQPYALTRPANMPYDGSAYVGYLMRRVAATNPNVPISGTGSAYDGGHYQLGRTSPVAPMNLKQPAAPARFADPAQQGVMDYLQAHNR